MTCFNDTLRTCCPCCIEVSNALVSLLACRHVHLKKKNAVNDSSSPMQGWSDGGTESGRD